MKKSEADNYIGEYKKEFIRLVQANEYKHRTFDIFRDFCEMTAISFNNAVSKQNYIEREQHYLTLQKKYNKEEMLNFSKMLVAIINHLEEVEFDDVLGSLYMQLELGSEQKGQFFTPYYLSRLMAKLIINSDSVETKIKENGFFGLNDPTVGAGGMVIAGAQIAKELGINYQQQMYVNATDIDIIAVHMTFIQLSLLHIPAIIYHGNTLTNELWGAWVTPSYILGNWNYKTRKLSNKLNNKQKEQAAEEKATGEEIETIEVIKDLPNIQNLTKQPENINLQNLEKQQQLSLF